NGGVFLGVEVDPTRARRRLETRYLDVVAKDLDEALRLCEGGQRKKQARSLAVIGNAAELFPELLRRGVKIDLVTDQTSAHDPLNGYVPQGVTLHQAPRLRKSAPTGYVARAGGAMAVQVRGMLGFQKAGSHVFDYGNNIR